MQNKKELKGVVISNKMQKTAVVRVSTKLPHPRFGKLINKWKKYYAHTEEALEVGQEVTIRQSKPISKTKRWKVVGKSLSE